MGIISDFLAHPGSYLFEAVLLVGMVVLVYRFVYVVNFAYHEAKAKKKADSADEHE